MVSLEPRIIDSSETKQPEVIQSDRRDILFCNFLMNSTNAVVDVQMTDVKAASYNNMTTEKYLAKHKQAKKKTYLKVCLAQHIHFTPLVFSVDGVMRREAQAFIKRLAKHLALKLRPVIFQGN